MLTESTPPPADPGWAPLLEAVAEQLSRLADATEAAAASSSANQGVRDALVNSARYAQSLAASILLWTAGHWAAACVLARTVLEMGVRLYWAASQPDGWRRFAIYFIEEDRKWATGAQTLMRDPSHADGVLENREQLLEIAKADGVAPMPALAGCLNELHKTERGKGAPSTFPYNQVYRPLSGLVHGRPTSIARDKDTPHRGSMVLYALLFGVTGLRLAAEHALGLDDDALRTLEQDLWKRFGELAADILTAEDGDA